MADPREVLERARNAVRIGDYADALRNYDHFYEHALDDGTMAYYGVRLSYCIGEWAELGKKFPAAAAQLEQKAVNALRLLEATRVPERFHDYMCICEVLGQSGKAVAKFLELHAADPELAQQLFRFIRPELIAAQEWAVAAVYLPAPEEHYKVYLSMLDQALKFHRDKGWNEEIVLKSHADDVSGLLLVLKNTGNDIEVARLKKRIEAEMISRGLPQLVPQIILQSGI